jgi:hypothetical protein
MSYLVFRLEATNAKSYLYMANQTISLGEVGDLG